MARHVEPTVNIGRDKNIISLEIVQEFQAEPARMFSIFADQDRWPENIPARVLKRLPNDKLITALPDFSRPEFTFVRTSEGCEVTLLHDLIKTQEDKLAYEKLWQSWFAELLKVVAP